MTKLMITKTSLMMTSLMMTLLMMTMMMMITMAMEGERAGVVPSLPPRCRSHALWWHLAGLLQRHRCHPPHPPHHQQHHHPVDFVAIVFPHMFMMFSIDTRTQT